MELRLDETGFGTLEIFQQPSAFCYGVDAVLLADFAAGGAAKKKEACRIMDLGTGTGIVPLILSHKTRAEYIAGIEVQENAWQLAEKNRQHNGLTARLHFFHCNVKAYPLSLRGTFDIVTTNPPYTPFHGGLESANLEKAIARHEIKASLDDFIKTASALLKDKGDFYMVHRPARLADICVSCRNHGLEPKEMRFVSGKPFERPNLLLVHCVKHGNPELRMLDPLFVHENDGAYSEEILKIYEKM